jgi:hypothetical protein
MKIRKSLEMEKVGNGKWVKPRKYEKWEMGNRKKRKEGKVGNRKWEKPRK